MDPGYRDRAADAGADDPRLPAPRIDVDRALHLHHVHGANENLAVVVRAVQRAGHEDARGVEDDRPSLPGGADLTAARAVDRDRVGTDLDVLGAGERRDRTGDDDGVQRRRDDSLLADRVAARVRGAVGDRNRGDGALRHQQGEHGDEKEKGLGHAAAQRHAQVYSESNISRKSEMLMTNLTVELAPQQSVKMLVEEASADPLRLA